MEWRQGRESFRRFYLISATFVTAAEPSSNADQIVTLTLQDPARPESKCYLDLDTGETFSNHEAPTDFIESRRWITKKGIDLMCESREPVGGLTLYDLALVKTNARIGDVADYASIRKTVEAAPVEPFNMLSLTKSDLPATYLFRTQEDAFGILEVTSLIDAPVSGAGIRYRILVPPPAALTGPARFQTQLNVKSEKALLERLEKTYLPNHPLVVAAADRLKTLQEIEKMQASEPDPGIASLKQAKIGMESALERNQSRLGPKSPQLLQMKQTMRLLDKQIALLEAAQRAQKMKMPTTAATTQPS